MHCQLITGGLSRWAQIAVARRIGDLDVVGNCTGGKIAKSRESHGTEQHGGEAVLVARVMAGVALTESSEILVPILIIPNVYEVFSRHALADPTSWAYDVTTYAFGALFMLCSAYALLKGAHVRTDIGSPGRDRWDCL